MRIRHFTIPVFIPEEACPNRAEVEKISVPQAEIKTAGELPLVDSLNDEIDLHEKDLWELPKIDALVKKLEANAVEGSVMVKKLPLVLLIVAPAGILELLMILLLDRPSVLFTTPRFSAKTAFAVPVAVAFAESVN